METLNFIVKRYRISLQDDAFLVPIRESRWREIPLLFRDLGFTRGVLLGVSSGRFAATLCLPNPNLWLIGVDEWDLINEDDESTGEDLREIFAKAKMRTSAMKITLIRASSEDAARRIDDESLDFVYLEGNHYFENVVRDIALWSKKVRKGGIVAGHGYIKNDKYDFDVKDAVNGWCNSYRIKPLFLWRDRCPSWMYIK